MKKKKNISKEQLISLYMDYVLENNEKPQSVFAFSKLINIQESKFYEFYGSFRALEEEVLVELFINSINVLEKNEDYMNYDSRNKLLSFYFTFFENLTANRSFILILLGNNQSKLSVLKQLKGLRKAFIEYVKQLDIEVIKLKDKRLEEIQERSLHESYWRQLIATLKFWMDDVSPSFEKTDESWQTFKSDAAEINRIALGDISVSEIETLKVFLDQQISGLLSTQSLRPNLKRLQTTRNNLD